MDEPKSERDILIQFYHDTGGDNWADNDNWCSDKPLEEWCGVTCNNEGRVIGLNLVDNNLSGNGNLSGLTALVELWCYYNQLASLDVSGCTVLEYLSCGGNQLTSLDVSGCTALVELCCLGNQLTSLDVSCCTALQYLGCESNQLTSLDVSGLTALEYLYCYDNRITQVIPDYLYGVDFIYDVRYYYWPDDDGHYTDRGVGWWYPGEPEKGYHGK
ncbi:MAG: hypothetical protein J6Q31_02230 [Alistipes sp.]|nr:hypothetical protein [Alistipes sp.]